MAQVQGSLNLLFRPGLRNNFRENYLRHVPEYVHFLKSEYTDLPETSAAVLTGFSRFFERGDMEAVTYQDIVMGPKVTVVDKEFASGFMISRKTVEDDQYGKANQAAKFLAHAGRMTVEYRAASFLDDAAAGSVFLGHDSLPLLSTAHTLLNSTKTFANTFATPIGFSNTGVSAMTDLAQQAIDQNGDPIVLNLDTLVLGNNAGDYNRAIQIFNSDLEPFTTGNQENALKARYEKMKIVVSHFKQSLKSWFMFDTMFNDAEMLIRRPIDFADTFDFDTSAAKFMSTMRFAMWFVDPIGWFGTFPT